VLSEAINEMGLKKSPGSSNLSVLEECFSKMDVPDYMQLNYT